MARKKWYVTGVHNTERHYSTVHNQHNGAHCTPLQLLQYIEYHKCQKKEKRERSLVSKSRPCRATLWRCLAFLDISSTLDLVLTTTIQYLVVLYMS